MSQASPLLLADLTAFLVSVMTQSPLIRFHHLFTPWLTRSLLMSLSLPSTSETPATSPRLCLAESTPPAILERSLKSHCEERHTGRLPSIPSVSAVSLLIWIWGLFLTLEPPSSLSQVLLPSSCKFTYLVYFW